MQLIERHLLAALELAQARRGFCAPNPSVGAVILKNECVISAGVHRGPNTPHAEADALNKLDVDLSEAELYVTLEPCCHHGRTPPCTDLIIEKGIKTVYYAVQDPDPRVAGQGEQQLRDAGIDVQRIEVPAITEFYRSYVFWAMEKMPWVRAKLALTGDGKIAGRDGTPIAITAEEANRYTHRQRWRSDAILTTVRTIINDDPKLNARVNVSVAPKKVYVLDTRLSMPLEAQLFKTAEKIIVLHASDADEQRRKQLENAGVQCVTIERDEKGLSLKAALKHIGEDGIHDLWVEAGGTCFMQLVKEQLAQQALIYVAGQQQAGLDAQSAFPKDFELMQTNYRLQTSELGSDRLLRFDLLESE